MAGSETLTVLFCDVVGSTELLAAVGDSVFEVARRELVGVGEEAVATAGGRIVKWMGDGAMATFPSASDALRAAIALQHGSRRVRAGGERLRLRVGISVGDVIVDGGDCHGTAVVEAARLCAAAEAGEVLCTEVVAVLARGQRGELETEAVGALALKGLPEPVAARRLVMPEPAGGAAGAGLPAALVAERASPLVGREVERKLLGEVVEAARGARAVGLVAGEPGIGKSRLVAEVAASAVEAGTRVVLGRCPEDLVAPFAPWAEVVATLVDAHAGDLDEVIERSGSVLARVVAGVAQRFPDLPPPPPVDPATERRRFAEAVDDLVCAVAQQAPLVVVLEDLHWADEPSLAILGHLVRPGAPAGLAVLGTYRQTDLDRRHPLTATLAALRRRPEVTRVSLSGLATAELADLVEAVAGQEPDDELVAALEAATEGNPFFAVEVLAHLAESGAYDYRDGRWVATVPVSELGLPEGVREVVGRRLSALDEATNAALSVLAVCGAEGDAAVVADVAGLGDDALDALDDAVRAGLAREVGAGRYGFAHALVRQTLLEEQSLARRARHHWQIGQAIARRRPRALADIAYHLVEGAQAGDPAEAVDATLAAADDAVERANVEEAILAYDRALEAMDVCDLDDDERRWHALVGKGDAGAQALDTEIVVDTQMAAIDLAERNGWDDRVAEALVTATTFPDYSLPHDRLVPLAERLLAQPQQPATRARLHIARSHLGFGLMDFAVAREHAVAALHIARDLDDFDLFGPAVQALMTSAEGGFTMEEMRAIADEAEQRAAAAPGAIRGHWRPEAAYTLPWRVLAALRAGERDAVEAALAEGEATMVGGMRFRLSLARRGLAMADGRLDDLETLDAQADENYPRLGLQIVSGAQDRHEARMRRGDRAAVAEVHALQDAVFRAIPDLARIPVRASEAELGMWNADRDELDAALDHLEVMGPSSGSAHTRAVLAELAARCGAVDLAGRLLPHFDHLGGRYLTGWGGFRFLPLERARAQALGVLGRADEAVNAAEAAVANDLDMRAPFLEAGSRRWLAWALERRAQPGDVDRAIGELRTAAAIAHRIDHVALAGECDGELARLGAG